MSDSKKENHPKDARKIMLFEGEKTTEIYEVTDVVAMMDYDLSLHCTNVANLIEKFGQDLEIKGIEMLLDAALTHDVGKIYISSDILHKPASLDVVEKEIMDTHAYISFRILSEMGFSKDVCTIVLYHHGMKKIYMGKDLPVLPDTLKRHANVLRTLDAYDALISRRSFRSGYTETEAIEILNTEGWYDAITLKLLKKMQGFF